MGRALMFPLKQHKWETLWFKAPDLIIRFTPQLLYKIGIRNLILQMG